MEITVVVLISIIIGVIISRIAGLIGSKVFKFSSIYSFLLKFFKNKLNLL